MTNKKLSSKKPDDYDVGYKKPPEQHRFKRGTSGNPKGRPRKTLDMDEDVAESLLDYANSKMSVRVDGKRMKMAKRDVLIAKLIDGAINAGPKEQKAVLDLIAKAEATRLGTETRPQVLIIRGGLPEPGADFPPLPIIPDDPESEEN